MKIWACARGHMRRVTKKFQTKDKNTTQLPLLLLLLLQPKIVEILPFERNVVFGVKRLWILTKICMRPF